MCDNGLSYGRCAMHFYEFIPFNHICKFLVEFVSNTLYRSRIVHRDEDLELGRDGIHVTHNVGSLGGQSDHLRSQ